MTQSILSNADYVQKLNADLRPSRSNGYAVLDLFAGCGGMSLGFESVGFDIIGFEMDKRCCATYNSNLQGGCIQETITRGMGFPPADAVIGGPPCQPFSVFGDQKGDSDTRDGVPAFIGAVKGVMPKLFMFENVRGILYKNKEYFEESLERLRSLGYVVEYRLLNMARYGVPQRRSRVIVVGHDGSFKFPSPNKRVVSSGEALQGLHDEPPGGYRFLTPSMDKYIIKYEKHAQMVRPRDLNLDKPARTLTCRNLAGATSDMHRIKLHDGRRRMLTMRECARLQSFPDWFDFAGSETSKFYQIGNAVPPLFACELAKSMLSYLDAYSRP